MLKVRGGVFSWTIPLEEIEAITESKNPPVSTGFIT
ncbi:PH domain-containing protein [Anoxybacillus rupiensis]|jgi:Bacterial PH domain|uniref:PH domain-containing protein n=1 Tax=Anoxybacteroides rupiense TaxID=311460 RepID=A0ABT5W4E1_9BACL|nr:PH domain-containing protein [Anoxybacillus rupiensis]MDE8563679.1 PH domain-containing protein [Anoxybacillus rupiensis]